MVLAMAYGRALVAMIAAMVIREPALALATSVLIALQLAYDHRPACWYWSVVLISAAYLARYLGCVVAFGSRSPAAVVPIAATAMALALFSAVQAVEWRLAESQLFAQQALPGKRDSHLYFAPGLPVKTLSVLGVASGSVGALFRTESLSSDLAWLLSAIVLATGVAACLHNRLTVAWAVPLQALCMGVVAGTAAAGRAHQIIGALTVLPVTGSLIRLSRGKPSTQYFGVSSPSSVGEDDAGGGLPNQP